MYTADNKQEPGNKPIGYDNVNQNILNTQINTLIQEFSTITNKTIRQYGINLIKELAKRYSEEEAQIYTQDILKY